MRRRDEGARAARTGEHDVSRLVADQQRVRDARRRPVERHDAHAVGEVVHDPHFVVGARGDGDRLHADGDRSAGVQTCGIHVEDLEPAVGRVDRKESRAVGR
jgi:hypothetical protein